MNQGQPERGIHELYAEDPERADWLLWGRNADLLTRRAFLSSSGLLAMTTILGAHIPFVQNMPSGLIPAALAASDEKFIIPGKEALTVLNDRPINAETPPHLLDDDVTPAHRLFVRNNGIPPNRKTIDSATWTLEIAGESCLHPKIFTIADLKKSFHHYTYHLQLECGGNGRSEFNPPAKGNQWTLGAIGCPTWTGVRLRDVLESCGIKNDAIYTGYYGDDTHLSGIASKISISRGVPMSKALEDESLIAWAMNGKDIPWLNGYPLRVITSGWPASTSGKWLKKIVIRNKVHDGVKMTGHAYRTPCKPVAPGTNVPSEDMCIIESMPVKSLITFPKSGITHSHTRPMALRGKAWAGDLDVKDVFVSTDFGGTWQKTTLHQPLNRLAWQKWEATVAFPQDGYYEVWAQAVDRNGQSQPMVLPGWNPKGYLNNACHRIAIQVI
ncbi:MAG: molybdopterin containing oxidoreductase [Nitrospiraceae bacterium]|nr:molybdopterin containing oxidoreductase [Nitrospiraceae bacterium]